jgi:hypothetical protein
LTGYDYTTPAGGNGQVDTDGHGTWIAGIIAGRGHGTGLGMLGIAPSARILPIRVAAARPNPSDGTVAKAIQQATKRGAKIIHVSGFGGDQATMDAVAKAVASGVLVIAPTGNSAFDKQIPPPASWPGVLTVSGVDKSGKVSGLYVTGSKIDFAAPGDGVITTDKTAGAYATPVSTSTPSAVVAGVAALVWAKYPKLKAAQIIQVMRSSATDKGAKGRDPIYGSGIINPVGALTAAHAIASPSPSVSPSPSLSPSAEESAVAGFSEAAVSPAASDRKGGVSPLALVAVAAGVIMVLVGAFIGYFLLRRSRSAPSTPPEAWAPQPLALPPPISPLAIGPPPGAPTAPVSLTPPATAAPLVASSSAAGALPSMGVVPGAEVTQPLRTVPAQQQPRHAVPAPPEPTPQMNRPPIDPAVLNQPTVTVQQPRFAFPADDAGDGMPSIYDTASFPVVTEDRRA